MRELFEEYGGIVFVFMLGIGYFIGLSYVFGAIVNTLGVLVNLY